MSFQEPLFLLAVLLVPVVGLYWLAERRRRRRFTIRHPGTAAAGAAVARVSPWRRFVPPALLALAGIALAVALARPETTVAVPIEKASVMLVVDESGSMLARDVTPSRIEAVQDAASRFLDRVPDELLVGFTSYSSGVHSLVEPTTDRDAVQSAIAALRADGGTATGDALSATLDRLEARRGTDGSTAPAAVILLSDGKTTEGSDPLEAASRAASLGIPVATVALGTAFGTVPGPYGEALSVPPDPQTLSEIAARSGGQAFEVGEADALDRVYETLGSRIGTRDEEREVTAAFAGGALVMLLAALGTGVRWRPRLA